MCGVVLCLRRSSHDAGRIRVYTVLNGEVPQFEGLRPYAGGQM